MPADRPSKQKKSRSEPYKAPKRKIGSRELVEATQSAPITSRNIPVAGETGMCKNNALETVIYEYGPESWVYNTFFSQVLAPDLLWYFYDDPVSDPNTYSPDITGELTEERAMKVVVKPKQCFTNGQKFDVLAIQVPASNKKGYIEYKIKHAGRNTRTNDGMPWFYIEEYQGPGLPMLRKYGELATNLSQERHAELHGTSFGRKKCGPKKKGCHKKNSLVIVNSDIRYLSR